jgi:hypothetical protein
VLAFLKTVQKGGTEKVQVLSALFFFKSPSKTKSKNENLTSPDRREHPALFQGRCGRKAGIWIAGKARAIRC